MSILVTGSAGHLGEGLMRTLRTRGIDALGVDRLESDFTDAVGTITDRDFVRRCMAGVRAVIHTATLHKPHVATHARRDFVDVNVTGTLNLLEEAHAADVDAFVFTSTTSVFGDALVPPPGEPAAWITEDVRPVPKNIYGATKAAAEDLCQLFQRNQSLPCLILRTSRFFLEADDSRTVRDAYPNDNVKANEYLCRRGDLEDMVEAHLLAVERARDLGFRRYVISATTPFARDDMARLRDDAAAVVASLVPGFEDEYARRGWRMFPAIDRVYVNARAREELGWEPRHDFASVLDRLRADQDPRSPLALAVGMKPYHDRVFEDGPYPVE